MSKHWGYVCRTHDPEIVSEMWLNHGDHALSAAFQLERRGQWPNYDEGPDGWDTGQPFPVSTDQKTGPVGRWGTGRSDACSDGPVRWLREHPNCDIALRNEYGDTLELFPPPDQAWVDRIGMLRAAEQFEVNGIPQ